MFASVLTVVPTRIAINSFSPFIKMTSYTLGTDPVVQDALIRYVKLHPLAMPES